MKAKIFLIFITFSLYLCYAQNIDCKYYMYLEAYEKYNQNKNFENLKDLITKSLEISKIKLEIMNESTDSLDTTLDEVKKMYDIENLKQKYNVIKYKIEKINKDYILYLIRKNENISECMKIVGDLEKNDFETIKNYYLMCNKNLKIEEKKEETEETDEYGKIYYAISNNNLTYLNSVLNNITIKQLKSDIEKYVESQKSCNDPICNISLQNKIKKELFILMCYNLNGKIVEYVENDMLYYGCELNKKPYSNWLDWINVSKNIYRPMDCILSESDKSLINEFKKN